MFERVAMAGIPSATQVNLTSITLTTIIILPTTVTMVIIITWSQVPIVSLYPYALFHHLPGPSVLGPGVQTLTMAVGVEFFRGAEERMENFVLVHADPLKLCQHMINSRPIPYFLFSPG
jgi:hypothetical protein